MQCPPTPGPCRNDWNPNGLVDAAPITSHRSIFRSWQNRAISLTSAMLTSISVFQEFGHFGFPRSLGFHHRIDKCAVEIGRRLGAVLGVAADHLRCVSRPEVLISGIDTLWRECEVEVNACYQAEASRIGRTTSSVVPGTSSTPKKPAFHAGDVVRPSRPRQALH